MVAAQEAAGGMAGGWYWRDAERAKMATGQESP